MAVILLTYGNINFYKAQQMSKKAALANGIDKVIMLDDRWLQTQTDFCNKNKAILNRTRGSGFWLWKPYIILETLKKLNDNDILFYLDSGAEIVKDISPLIAFMADKEIILFRTEPHINNAYIKRDCFYYMGCDEPKYHNGPQLLAGLIMLKNTKKNIELLEEWLKYAEDSRIITDDPNVCGLDNLPGFIDHRHDQAILSLLAAKHNIPLFRDPTQFGDELKNTQNPSYGTLIDLHRGKYPMFFADRVKYYLAYKEYNKAIKLITDKGMLFLKKKIFAKIKRG